MLIKAFAFPIYCPFILLMACRYEVRWVRIRVIENVLKIGLGLGLMLVLGLGSNY